MCDGKGEQGETYPPVDEEQRVGVGSVEEWEYQDQEHKKWHKRFRQNVIDFMIFFAFDAFLLDSWIYERFSRGYRFNFYRATKFTQDLKNMITTSETRLVSDNIIFQRT